MQLMSARQINDHDCRVILDHDFCYIQDRCTSHWLALALVVVTHCVFVSLPGFVFLPQHSSVLSALPSLLHLRRNFLSDIIVWATFVALDCLHC
jgi:hypothetical protein